MNKNEIKENLKPAEFYIEMEKLKRHRRIASFVGIFGSLIYAILFNFSVGNGEEEVDIKSMALICIGLIIVCISWLPHKKIVSNIKKLNCTIYVKEKDESVKLLESKILSDMIEKCQLLKYKFINCELRYNFRGTLNKYDFICFGMNMIKEHFIIGVTFINGKNTANFDKKIVIQYNHEYDNYLDTNKKLLEEVDPQKITDEEAYEVFGSKYNVLVNDEAVKVEELPISFIRKILDINYYEFIYPSYTFCDERYNILINTFDITCENAKVISDKIIMESELVTIAGISSMDEQYATVLKKCIEVVNEFEYK